MAYKRKTRDHWDIETNWGYGWNTECSEYTWGRRRHRLDAIAKTPVVASMSG